MNCRKFFKLQSIIGVGLSSTAATVAGLFIHAQCAGPEDQRICPINIFTDAGNWYKNWDKREPASLIKRSRRNPDQNKKITQEELAKQTTSAIRYIFLIRHGQYNTAGQTDTENYLTPLGIEQAGLTGKRLAELSIDKFDSITSSDMTRAKETTDQIKDVLCKAGVPISNMTVDPLLQEGMPASPDPPYLGDDGAPDLSVVFTDGARIEAAYRKYIHRASPQQENDSHEIIVCHANVIRYFFCRALQFPGEAWLRLTIDHSSLTVLSVHPSGHVVAQSLGDTSHIPVEKCTYY